MTPGSASGGTALCATCADTMLVTRSSKSGLDGTACILGDSTWSDLYRQRSWARNLTCCDTRRPPHDPGRVLSPSGQRLESRAMPIRSELRRLYPTHWPEI